LLLAGVNPGGEVAGICGLCLSGHITILKYFSQIRPY
jgi:hypothetical protein